MFKDSETPKDKIAKDRQRKVQEWLEANPLESRDDWWGPDKFKSGLLGKILAKLVPDKVFGVDLSAVCHVHDAEYSVPGTEEDRKACDKALGIGVFKALRAEKFWVITCLLVGYIYWREVNKFGHNLFDYYEDYTLPSK